MLRTLVFAAATLLLLLLAAVRPLLFRAVGDAEEELACGARFVAADILSDHPRRRYYLTSMKELSTVMLGSGGGDASMLLRRLYHLELTSAQSRLPLQMKQRLLSQGLDPTSFESQTTMTISSRLLPHESLVFNRVRSRRFGVSASGSGGAVDARLIADLGGLDCGLPASSDFCEATNRTMADASLGSLGHCPDSTPNRIPNPHPDRDLAQARVGYLSDDRAVAFANMGRVTALHGVVATRRFASPIRLSRDDIVGMMGLCQQWFVRMHAAYGPAEAQHPTLTFDLLPNGGASQTHPHMQPHLVSAARYPGKWESMRRVACAYNRANPSGSYYRDVAHVHERIGLVVHRTQRAIAFVSLTSAGSGPQIDILADGDVLRGGRPARTSPPHPYPPPAPPPHRYQAATTARRR